MECKWGCFCGQAAGDEEGKHAFRERTADHTADWEPLLLGDCLSPLSPRGHDDLLPVPNTGPTSSSSSPSQISLAFYLHSSSLSGATRPYCSVIGPFRWRYSGDGCGFLKTASQQKRGALMALFLKAGCFDVDPHEATGS